MTTGSDMRYNLGYVLEWVRDTLALQSTNGWYWQKSHKPRIPFYLEDIIRQFFKGGDFIASVTAEASRDPIGRRHLGFGQSLMKSSPPTFLFYANELRHKNSIDLKDNLVLSTREFRFAVPKGIDERQTKLTVMHSERVMPRPRGLPIVGKWTTWCVAEEDTDRLIAGSAPASKNLLLANDINPARLMTWWKLYPKSIKQNTYTIAFDIDPTSGDVFSVRYAVVPLEMQILLDPWLDDWLLEFIYKQIMRSKSIGSRLA